MGVEGRRVHIMLTFDDSMLGPAGVCLTSLALHRGDEAVTAHILHHDIPSSSLEMLVRHCVEIGIETRLYRVDPGELIALHAGLAYRPLPVPALFRCILARYVPLEIERILYIDVDTIILGSLRELFEMDLENAIAAVGPNPSSALLHLGIGDDEYFNAGVMLIDMTRWRAEDVEHKLLDALKRHAADIRFMDQCVLNIVLRGQVVFFDRKYNYIYDNYLRRTDYHTPVLVHYAGGIKPWARPYSHPWGGAYIEIAAMTPWPVSAQVLREWGVPIVRAYRRRFLKAVGLRKA
jgi:lipopolysaccharide biosynthesis glycosyltransferase